MLDQNCLVVNPGATLVPIKAWVQGVEIEQAAVDQLTNTANLPIIYRHIAVMPDVHMGVGATVGSVIPTKGAIIPAAVGVDIGCGMIAVQTTLTAEPLPDGLGSVRSAIENAVPHGGPGTTGTWVEQGRHGPPDSLAASFHASALDAGYATIVARHPKIAGKQDTNLNQLGTLGGGNHFIEVCLDESNTVWIMLHSGSRGVGNRIGSYFIELAREDMRRHMVTLPDRDLAYLT